jgi:NTE family protein
MLPRLLGGCVRKSFYLLILLLNVGSMSFCQIEPPSPSRPRIGLALSGGGALGLAHVGVIKYFEEHHIPIHAIAGTSMGGLVGGFYATGLDSQQLDHVVRTVDFTEIFRSSPEYDDRGIAEKQDWHRSAGVTMRFRRNLSLPTGLNPGQPLALLLSRYTAAYSELKSFDELPTPFRCVATDLTSATAFTLESGSLPQALRATMALPGIFTPVSWGDRVLVDGAAVDNIPVDVARSMNTDVVIAVSLETEPIQAKSLNSLTSVLKQVVNVVVLENERRSLKQADIVIAVPFHKYTATDYESATEIMAQGYKAAQSMAEELKPYEVSDAEWQEYLRARQRRTQTAPDKGRIVAVKSEQPKIQQDAQHELARKLSGFVTRQQLEETLTGITAATSLPSAYYGWSTKKDEIGYQVRLERRPEGGEILVRPALSMQASGGEPTRTALQLSWVRSLHDSYKSRLLGEATIGFDPGVRFEYYKPFDGEPYFIAPGMLYQRTHDLSYTGATVNDFVRDRIAGTFYAGLGTWRFVQWRVGTTAGYDRYNPPTNVSGVPANSTPFANIETTLLVDTQDSGTLPSRGTRIDGKTGYSVREQSFPYFDAKFSHYFKVKKEFSVIALGRGATSFGTNLTYYDQFTGGGLSDLSAFRYDQFHANTMATGGGGFYFGLPRFHDFKSVFAVWDEAGRFDLGNQGWQTHNSANAGLFLPTPLGPAGVVVSFTEDGKARFRFVFGRF